MLEKDLERKVRDFCKTIGCKRKKMSSPASKGTLDDVFMKDGVSIWVELKVKNNKPTRLQWLEIYDLRRHGIPAYWANSLEQVKGLLLKTPGWEEALPPQEQWMM